MDNMENGQTFDEVLLDAPQNDAKILVFEDEAPKKRAPYTVWMVGEREYKLKLTAGVIVKLEGAFHKNLLLAMTDDGLPPVSDMLFVIQGGLQRFHHGMNQIKVQDLYDQYVECGGNQMSLLADVIMPLLSVSGFFTENQAETLSSTVKDLDSNI